MRAILTGGGTGGHIYPALAIAERLKQLHPGDEVLYVGTQKGLESRIVPQCGVPFRTIEAEGLPRRVSPELFRALWQAARGCAQARQIIRQFRPDVVIGTGGYVCGPVVLAAHLAGVPTMIHEQNAFPGMTNKLLARFADVILVTFAASEQYFVHKERIRQTGLPVRQAVLQTSKADGLRYFGFSPEKTTLLASGGSRGARSLNRAMAEAYPELLREPDLQILHLTGAQDYEETLRAIAEQGIVPAEYPQLLVKPYLDEMQYALAAADLCVGRAGATFLAEITACGLPAILIPYPYAAENHQEYNARALAEHGAAVMILDAELDGPTLARNILELCRQPERRARMAEQARSMGRRDALDQIVALAEQYRRE